MNKNLKTPDEEVRDFPGYEGLYAVAKSGKVWSYRSHRWMKPAYGKSEYRIANLWKDGSSKSFYLHRMVAIVWLPNPNNLPEVNHKDGIRGNCDITNLEWCDHTYNIRLARNKKVYCKELNKVYSSAVEASKELNIPSSTLYSHLIGNQSKAGGYHFNYV